MISSVCNTVELFDLKIGEDSPGSLVDNTAAHVRNLILSGKLQGGTKLPGVRELADKWPVSYVVIQKALEHCSNDGLIVRHPRRGTFVADKIHRRDITGCIYIVVQQTEEEISVIDHYTDKYFLGLMAGFQKELTEKDIIVMTISIAGVAQEKILASKLRKYPADLVVLARSKNTEVISEITGMNIPLLLLDPHVYPGANFNVMTHDENRAAEDILNYFLENGRRKIGCLFLDDGKWVTANRMEAVRKAISSKKLAFNRDWMRTIERPIGEESIHEAFDKIYSDKGISPDAIIVSGISETMLSLVINRYGLFPPDKPVIATYVSNPMFVAANFSVDIDSYKYGLSAGKFIFNNFYRENKNSIPRNSLIPFPVEQVNQIK